MPNAPADLACKMVESTHASRDRYAEHSGIPCAMVYGLYALSPVSGLVSHRHRRIIFRRLDPSVGRSGPRDFAVRIRAFRQRARTRPSHPVSRLVTIGRTPL